MPDTLNIQSRETKLVLTGSICRGVRSGRRLGDRSDRRRGRLHSCEPRDRHHSRGHATTGNGNRRLSSSRCWPRLLLAPRPKIGLLRRRLQPQLAGSARPNHLDRPSRLARRLSSWRPHVQRRTWPCSPSDRFRSNREPGELGSAKASRPRRDFCRRRRPLNYLAAVAVSS